MNWKKIFKNNKHAIEKFQEYLERNYNENVLISTSTLSFLTITVKEISTFFNDRDLYDFFDWCNIIGTVKYLDNGFTYKIKTPSDVRKCNSVSPLRFQAESDMFEEMFNILNNKLSDKL